MICFVSSGLLPNTPLKLLKLGSIFEILSVKPAQMDNLAGINESINFPVSLEILNTPQPTSQMNFNPIYQNQNTNQNTNITMTKPYQTTHSSLPFSFKIKNTNNSNSNSNDIMPMNTNDFDNFAEYQLTHPKINLLAAKGPNNFFIPNIWIEE